MKSIPSHLAAIVLVLLGALLLAGCGGGGGGSNQDYGGIWQGRTSHDGTVAFTVIGNSVTSLRIVDAQADVWILNPVEIEGDSFSAKNSEGATSPGSPAVSVQGTFDSATQAFGRYAITKAGNTWSGTFEAAKQ